METTANNQVAIIEKSLDILKTGPEILIANQVRKDKALTVGRNILSAIEETGMTPELDERANNYLSNITKANTEMKASRAPVTQIMDQLKKMYTEVENDIDSKKPDTVPAKIQSHRDRFAKEVAAEVERKRIAAEKAAQKAKDIIEIRYQMESSFAGQYSDILLQKKTKVSNAFNAITLENFEVKSEALKNAKFVFADDTMLELDVNPSLCRKFTSDEILEIQNEIVQAKMPDAISNYTAEMELLKDELIEKLPSKLSELKEQKRLADEAEEKQRLADEAAANAKSKAQKAAAEKAKADAKAAADAQEKAAADQKKREEKEAADRDAKADEDHKAAMLAADIKKQGEETMVLFEQEAAMAETSTAPEARQGFEIVVLHPVGFTQIFAVWFDKEGKKLPVDKIGNTKMDQMKAYCEKIAHKEGFFIEGKFLKYEDSFKAVNRKVK